MQIEERKDKNIWYAYVGAITAAMLVSFIIVSYYYKTQINSFYERSDASSFSEIVLHQTILRREIHAVSSDIRLLSVNPMMQGYLDDRSEEQHHQLMVFWKRVLTERDNYDQLRFLDVDGKEVLRVDYNDKVPICLPNVELQDKSDTDYFEEIQKLRRGRIFVSSLNLNQEDGVPEYPFKPTVRFGIGVYDSGGKRVGSLVINYNIQNYLNIIKASTKDEQADFMLLNPDGYWVMHPNADFEWGQFVPGNKGVNFSLMHPEAWEKIREQKMGKFTVGDEVYDFDTFDLQGHQNFVSTRRVKDSSTPDVFEYDTQLKYVALLPAHVIAAFRKQIYTQCLIILLVWLILSLIPCWGLASFIVSHYHDHSILSRKAHFDTVTGLANRVLFNERFDHALQMAQRYDRICALLYVDLDGFKAINDEHGHHIGDELLIAVAGRMLQCVRKTDTVARIGGDEFAILLTEITTKADAMLIGEKVVSRLFDPVPTSKEPVSVGASIGIAVYPEDGVDADKLIKLADKYMYNNKRAHKQKLGLSREAS